MNQAIPSQWEAMLCWAHDDDKSQNPLWAVHLSTCHSLCMVTDLSLSLWSQLAWNASPGQRLLNWPVGSEFLLGIKNDCFQIMYTQRTQRGPEGVVSWIYHHGLGLKSFHPQMEKLEYEKPGVYQLLLVYCSDPWIIDRVHKIWQQRKTAIQPPTWENTRAEKVVLPLLAG